MCAYSLDHITPSRLGVAVPVVTSHGREYCNDSNIRNLSIPALASYDTFWTIRLKRSLLPYFSKNATPASTPGRFNLYVCAAIHHEAGGACRDRTDDPLLAKQVLSQLS